MKNAALTMLAIAAVGCAAKLRTVETGISVTPETLDFGAVQVGESQSLTVQISNVSIAPLDVAAIKVALDPAGELSISAELTTNCSGKPRTGTTLASGECAQFVATWKPLAAHAAQGSVEIDSDDPETPSMSLPVSGTASIPTEPQLRVCALTAQGTLDDSQCTTRSATALANVPSINFGSGVAGQTLTRTVRLFNDGIGSLTLSPAPSLAASSAPDFSLSGSPPAALTAGASTDLQVAVKPSANGTLQAALDVFSDDSIAAHVSVPLTVSVGGWQLCVTPSAGLSFGGVTIGQSQTLAMTYTNCGNAPFTLNTFALTPSAPTVAQFSVASGQLPVTPLAMNPGDKFTVQVTYAPTLAQADGAHFDAVLAVPGGQTVQQTWPVTGTGVLVPGGCSPAPTAEILVYKNGGTSSINPLTTTFAPLDTATLSGSRSVAQGGSPQYTWQILSEPSGANDPLQGSGVSVNIQMRQAGNYSFALTVKDGRGCVSAETPVTLRVVPSGTVHVELTWKENYGDVDLHYVGPDGTFFEDAPYTGDLYYENSHASAVGSRVTPDPTARNPDWGKNNTVEPDGLTSNDASLDVDQQWGQGPENVTHAKPFDGVYQVFVHYFCASPNEDSTKPEQGPATATVRIWINGVLYPGTPPTAVMQAYQAWNAATITIANNATSFTVSYPSGGPKDSDAFNCSQINGNIARPQSHKRSSR